MVMPLVLYQNHLELRISQHTAPTGQHEQPQATLAVFPRKQVDGNGVQMAVDFMSHSLKVSVQKDLISFLKLQPELDYKIN